MLNRSVLLAYIACVALLGFVALHYDRMDAFNTLILALVSLSPGASQLRRARKD